MPHLPGKDQCGPQVLPRVWRSAEPQRPHVLRAPPRALCPYAPPSPRCLRRGRRRSTGPDPPVRDGSIGGRPLGDGIGTSFPIPPHPSSAALYHPLLISTSVQCGGRILTTPRATANLAHPEPSRLHHLQSACARTKVPPPQYVSLANPLHFLHSLPTLENPRKRSMHGRILLCRAIRRRA